LVFLCRVPCTQSFAIPTQEILRPPSPGSSSVCSSLEVFQALSFSAIRRCLASPPPFFGLSRFPAKFPLHNVFPLMLGPLVFRIIDSFFSSVFFKPWPHSGLVFFRGVVKPCPALSWSIIFLWVNLRLSPVPNWPRLLYFKWTPFFAIRHPIPFL